MCYIIGFMLFFNFLFISKNCFHNSSLIFIKYYKRIEKIIKKNKIKKEEKKENIKIMPKEDFKLTPELFEYVLQ